MRESDPQGALALLSEVLELEEQKDEWGFRALKQKMKIYFRQVWVALRGGHVILHVAHVTDLSCTIRVSMMSS